jgi:hypothetical protein
MCAALGCEGVGLFDIGYRQDAGHDFCRNTGRRRPVAEAQECARFKKNCDSACGPRIQLGFQVVQIGLRAGRFRMAFRVAATEISKGAIWRRPRTRAAALS